MDKIFGDLLDRLQGSGPTFEKVELREKIDAQIDDLENISGVMANSLKKLNDYLSSRPDAGESWGKEVCTRAIELLQQYEQKLNQVVYELDEAKDTRDAALLGRDIAILSMKSVMEHEAALTSHAVELENRLAKAEEILKRSPGTSDFQWEVDRLNWLQHRG